MRLGVPAALAVLFFLLTPLDNASLRCRQQDDPVSQSGKEERRQWEQRAPSIGGVKEALNTARGPKRSATWDCYCQEDREGRLEAKVPGEGLGL